MKFLNHLLKKNWLLALFILLVLWLLPRLLDAYAYVFLRAGEFVEKVGAVLKIPAATIAKASAAVAKVGKVMTDNPVVHFVVPVLLWTVAPIPAALLSVWGILDFFKPHETITITRTTPASSPTTTTLDTPASSGLLMPNGQSVDDFYAANPPTPF